MIQKCETCLKHHYKQTKEPILIADLPTAPWQKVGTDLFHLHGKDDLLGIDYYSNYPEVAQLSSTSAQSVITHMKGFFARHGIPQCVVSDNGPQYDCGEFSEFAKQYGFQQITSSPLYLQANGQASDSKTDPYLALLSYRPASLECGASPAELLMHRKLRTTLPHILKDNDDKNNNKLTDKRMTLKHRQKMNYDKTARCLEPLQEKDVVRIEGPDFWARKATVLSEVGPRSFVVKTENGQVLRRNRRSLLKTQDTENLTEETESEQQDDAAQDVQHSEPPSPSPMTETLRGSTRPRKPPERLIEQG
uniref:Integrase catalytic domain-containing protein n=1 Tax=Seriola lalandi dorsalis TaxID=1841481 RepID=A0A3B4WVJ3_SERLL